jgi:hypothetical protein
MRRIIFLSLLFIGLLANCVSAPKQPEPVPPAPEAAPSPTQTEEALLSLEPKPKYYLHEVRWPEETLSHIALWYTGSSNNWVKIVEANPGLKPLRIHIGDKILIPEELLKVREPMPRDYVYSLPSPKRPPLARSSQPSKGPKKEELFGPVELLSPSGASASEKDELYGPIDLNQPPANPQPPAKGK